ncbi:6422_t:CDS:1, partial [Dentiscutata heterogama]
KQSNENFLLGINEEEFDLRDPDSDYNILDDDSISSATATESLANEINNVTENNEMEPLFVWDELAFEKAKMLANEKECNYDNEIEWDDLDYESLETASLTTQSTESSNYLLEDNCEKNKLTPCVLLHVDNGQIQRCSKYKQKTQRPLAQLVGSWEIDSEAFESVKNNNQLYTLGVCGSHFGFDQNDLHSPNLKASQDIEKSW